LLLFRRWLLVLFSRDFQQIDDVIKLWDGLFADGLDLDLIDYVFIALLMYLKDDRMQLSSYSFSPLLHLVFVFYMICPLNYHILSNNRSAVCYHTMLPASIP